MITIIGTVAFDGIETPQGKYDKILGGSAMYAATAANLFSDVGIVSIVGQDFDQEYFDYFKKRNIDTTGIAISSNRTFFWQGYYEKDLNQAFTRETQLNCLLEFDPKIPEKAQSSRIVLLANVDPVLQKKALDQFASPELVVLDTMNFWISTKPNELKSIISQADVLIINDQEIRQLTQIDNIIAAMPEVLKMGPKRLIVKKGEHGAIMFNGKDCFCLPAIPLTSVVDPTGAGDSFAGGFVGFLDSQPNLNEDAFRKAMIVGTMVSSFTVQGFGVNRLASVTKSDIEQQFLLLKSAISLPTHLFE